jgi:hypothetical protein
MGFWQRVSTDASTTDTYLDLYKSLFLVVANVGHANLLAKARKQRICHSINMKLF